MDLLGSTCTTSVTLISKSTFPTGCSTLTSDEIAGVLANAIQSSSAELLLAREYRTLTPREYFDRWAEARSQFGLPMNETIETKPLFGEPAQVFYRRAPSRRPSRRLLCLNQVPCLTRHVTGGDRHRGHWQMRSRCGRIEFGSLPPRLTGSPAHRRNRNGDNTLNRALSGCQRLAGPPGGCVNQTGGRRQHSQAREMRRLVRPPKVRLLAL